MSVVRNSIKKLELLKDLLQTSVDQGAKTVEQVHQVIADMPFEILEKSGLLNEEGESRRELSKNTIGTVYNAIRRINHEIGEFASDIFENLEDGDHINDVIDQKIEQLKNQQSPE